MEPVHPRVCGELDDSQRRRSHPLGSSPRVRGTRRPVCIGGRGAPVHPRVCGELSFASMMASWASGSSPRVRGTLDRREHVQLNPRFIPACAGNSIRSASNTMRPFGSSPRVRGTRRGTAPDRASSRFIPACAGNSRCRLPALRTGTVHPRVCGELASKPATSVFAAGSSPRVRGTRPASWGSASWRGFIPACAGNSGSRRRGCGRWPVHPRVCGELPRDAPAALPGQRFIPACAGNSTVSVNEPMKVSVHPRVCGELCQRPCATASRSGSSPRVRGTHQRDDGAGDLRRFIPACAGNSRRPRRVSTRRPVHPRVCGELALPLGRRRPAERFIPACAGNSVAAKCAMREPSGSSPRVRGTR